MYIHALAMSGSTIFAGSTGGVFFSTDSGSSWTAANTGLLNMNIQSLVVAGTNLFAGTNGSSVWRRPLSDFQTAVKPPPQKPKGLQTKLRVISSNSGYVLNYTLPSVCFVEISIYSISGKKTALLDQGNRVAGEHALKFNGSKMPAGLYMYRFKAGSYENCGGLMLTKR
jgi:hypothetical protein